MTSFHLIRKLAKHERKVRKGNLGRKAHKAKEILVWKGFCAWMYLESNHIFQVRGVNVLSYPPKMIVALLEGEQHFIKWLKSTSIDTIMTMLSCWPFSAEQQRYARLAYASLCAN
jgi:hypothetical protein